VSAPLLKVEGLCVVRGGRRVLHDLRLHVARGEVLGLLGPNGSGKSTLLACLAGLLPAQAGVLSWDDERLSPGQRAQPLFLLPDGLAPWPRLTVAELLDLAIRGSRGDAARRSALTQALGLAPFLQRPLGQLSKGQGKRALLAYALLLPRPGLLLDEPFDGLDLRQLRQTVGLLREEAARGRLLVLALHQLREAERACDRLLLLHEGRVAGEGSPDQLRAQAGLPGADLEEVMLALA
jgi:ABC-2 type transport system ATP-binding protein